MKPIEVDFIQQGKLNIIIDGQFGSTGKGLISSFIGCNEHVDVALTNSSPNAGHTFDIGYGKQVAYHLPISGILQERSTIYLTSGSIINPDILLKEISTFDIDETRLCIDPRAAIIEDIDINEEMKFSSSVSKIASTRKGVGHALSRKILRKSKLARNCTKLLPYIKDLDLMYYLDQDCTMLMEVPQGFDLSINSGLEYPYCTSREITIASALSDAQIHPSYLGNVLMCVRTYPIRVGNLLNDGEIIGYSGPFFEDSKEQTWNDLGLANEYTTNTKRIRRVATFSEQQYKNALNHLRPTHIFLNFANYMNIEKLSKLLKLMSNYQSPDFIGFGHSVDDVLDTRKESYESNSCLFR